MHGLIGFKCEWMNNYYDDIVICTISILIRIFLAFHCMDVIYGYETCIISTLMFISCYFIL